MLAIEMLHHVSLPVSDLERARKFYAEIIGLTELERPPFPFPGAWFQIGDRQLHLIGGDSKATFRIDKPVDSHDAHFAIRVRSFKQAVEHLRSLGYAPDAVDPMRVSRENAAATAGFPQIFVLDPDRNVVEINAAVSD